MESLERTPLFSRHEALGAQMVPLWRLGDARSSTPPASSKSIWPPAPGPALFDVSHMGRFIVKGDEALPFLQHALTKQCGRPRNGPEPIHPDPGAGRQRHRRRLPLPLLQRPLPAGGQRRQPPQRLAAPQDRRQAVQGRLPDRCNQRICHAQSSGTESKSDPAVTPSGAASCPNRSATN